MTATTIRRSAPSGTLAAQGMLRGARGVETGVVTRVLVGASNAGLRADVQSTLSRLGYVVTVACSAVEAERAIEDGAFDLVVLYWSAASLDTIGVCRRVRGWSQVPILLVSPRLGEMDRVTAFEAGADDFLLLPYGARELAARVAARLRRHAQPFARGAAIIRIGDLTLDFSRRAVEISGRQVGATPTELKMLAVLASAPGEVVAVKELMAQMGVLECSARSARQTVRTNVRRLRQKIEDNPDQPVRLLTHRGYGYSLSPGA